MHRLRLLAWFVMSQADSAVKYFTREQLGEPGFDWSQFPVEEQFVRNNAECSYVQEEVSIYRVPVLSSKGKVINTTVTLAAGREEESMEFKSAEDPSEIVGEIVIRPRLNCYLQNDSRLVSAIKEKVLISPSSNQYNLDGRHTLGDGQPRLLDQRYFRERRKGGFFIEAGAYDGESESTTIHYELEHGWTGLLVEPLPTNFHRLLKKNRKVWAAQTCLSTQQSPETVNFSLSASSKQTMSGISGAEQAENQSDSVKMQCLPLFSLLQALGNPTVDFLSLDIEGAEYQVLKNIPWDLVDIRAIAVETQFAGEVMEGTRQDIVELLLSVGYTHLDTIARDDIFVKLEPNSHSSQLEMPELFQRTLTRRCSYYRVPADRLATHCRHMYPMDYYSKTSVDNLPECLTRQTCPYDLEALLKTFRAQAAWEISLSDGCMYVQ